MADPSSEEPTPTVPAEGGEAAPTVETDEHGSKPSGVVVGSVAKRTVITGSMAFGALAFFGGAVTDLGIHVVGDVSAHRINEASDEAKLAATARIEHAELAQKAKVAQAAKLRGMFIELLQGEADTYLTPSVNNPYTNRTGATVPSQTALNAVVATLKTPEAKFETFELLDMQRIDGHAMFFGGPVANVYSRQILGHLGRSPLLGLANAHLPMTFSNVLVPIGAHIRPKYHLHVDGRVFTSKPGLDYLLLTRIPNVFSSEYGLSKHGILVASGMHGAGMIALSLILSNPDMMQGLLTLVRSFGEAWQTVFIVHVNTATGQPLGIESTEVARPVHADFDRIKRHIGNGAFWIAHDDPSNEHRPI